MHNGVNYQPQLVQDFSHKQFLRWFHDNLHNSWSFNEVFILGETMGIYVSMQYDHYEHLCVYAVWPLEKEGTYKVILHAIMWSHSRYGLRLLGLLVLLVLALPLRSLSPFLQSCMMHRPLNFSSCRDEDLIWVSSSCPCLAKVYGLSPYFQLHPPLPAIHPWKLRWLWAS